MKKILLIPVKNEAWILEKSLQAGSLWADHIIVADQGSTDGSLDIYKKFPKVKVVSDKVSSTYGQIRKVLLDEARKIPGEGNAIFNLDADEILTSHVLSKEFWQDLEKVEPGRAILLQWINLWGSIKKYRRDSSVWSDSWKHFIFIDDRKSDFPDSALQEEHTYRLPEAYTRRTVKMDFPKVLHFQFINLSRMSSKQCHSRILEFFKGSGTRWQALKINHRYFPARWDKKMRLSETPGEWYSPYGEFIEKFPLLNKVQWEWYDADILNLFKKFGLKKFFWLDIWGVDWAAKFKLLPQEKREKYQSVDLLVKRPLYIKFYHRYGQKILELLFSLFHKKK